MAIQPIHDPIDYSNELRVLEPTDLAHANTFNPLFQRLINNDNYLKVLLGTMAKKTDIPTALPANGGNADTVGGFKVGTGVNNVVVRNSSGYIDSTWFNSSRGSENTPASQYLYDTGEGYMRKKDLANVKAEIVTSNAVTTGLGYTPVNQSMVLEDGVDLNTVVASGFYRLSNSHGNTPTGIYYGQLIVSRGADTVFQIVTGFGNNDYYMRQGNPVEAGGYGGFSDWRRLWHDGNLNPANFAPSGFGLGAFSKEMAPGQNLDDYNLTGFYRGVNVENAPNSGWWWILVQSHSNIWVSQIAISYGSGNQSNYIYTRVLEGEHWTPWERVARFSDVPTTLPANGGNADTLDDKHAAATLNTVEKSDLAAAINEVFQYANDGKTAIASAITAKGVSASPSDTFSLLAGKVGQITTGKKYASGNIAINVSFTGNNGTGNFSQTVSGLAFNPKYLFIGLANQNGNDAKLVYTPTGGIVTNFNQTFNSNIIISTTAQDPKTSKITIPIDAVTLTNGAFVISGSSCTLYCDGGYYPYSSFTAVLSYLVIE